MNDEANKKLTQILEAAGFRCVHVIENKNQPEMWLVHPVDAGERHVYGTACFSARAWDLIASMVLGAQAAHDALRFIREWFLKLEDGCPDDDPLTKLRRQYHAPVHAEIDKVLGPLGTG